MVNDDYVLFVLVVVYEFELKVDLMSDKRLRQKQKDRGHVKHEVFSDDSGDVYERRRVKSLGKIFS